MNRRAFLGLIGLLSTVPAAVPAAGSPPQSDPQPDGVPQASELSGDWMSFADLHTLPSVNSPKGGCQVGANLLSIEALTFPPFSQGGGTAGLSINGTPINAAAYRWCPHEVLRRAVVPGTMLHCDTAVRLCHDCPLVLLSLRMHNAGNLAQTVHLEIALDAYIRNEPGVWSWWVPRPAKAAEFKLNASTGTQTVTIEDARSASAASFAFSGLAPRRINRSEHSATAHWNLLIPPAQGVHIGMVLAVGETPAQSAALATRRAAAFELHFAEVQAAWQQQFESAFTPGNKLFSGNLPVLHTTDVEMRRVYYMSVASLLALQRRCFSTAQNAYVTGGPQCAASLMYFWDTFTWSTLHALLDPENMKKMLLRWLNLNIHNCYAQDMNSGAGVGPWYSFNDYVVFYQIDTYIRVTGDIAFLHMPVAGGTVLDQLEKMAFWWRRLVKPGCPLADYGLADNLLECVPTYAHVVASLNAANVWMMRQLSAWLHMTGARHQADAAAREAEKLAGHVKDLYIPGTGYWNTIHPGERKVPVRHCIDFFTVIACMNRDMSPLMRHQMAEFVDLHLLTDHWMRALAIDDPAAPVSNRPDHGPMGAYDAWPPFTIDALCRIGHWPMALAFLRRCARTTREGCYGQSHELLTTSDNSPVRKAHRGGQMYNCSCSGAFADVIIRTFFGVEFDHEGRPTPLSPSVARGFSGTLIGIRAGTPNARHWSVHSGASGLKIE